MQIVNINRPKRRRKGRSRKKKARRQTARDFYRSDEWIQLRYRALRLHDGCCMCCGASASEGVRLNVDHIYPRSKYPSLALDINNLQVLCARCNWGKGWEDTTDWRADAISHMAEICDPRFIEPS